MNQQCPTMCGIAIKCSYIVVPYNLVTNCVFVGQMVTLIMIISTGRAENSTGPLCSRAVNEKLDVILQNPQNICWCIYRGSPSENKFYIFTNILVKSTHFWLLLIAFIKLVKL